MATSADGNAVVEGWLTTRDGEKLYTKTWRTQDSPKARIAFVHGFSDHCNTYADLFPTFAQNGIETYAFDQRGWGRSVKTPKQKGLSGSTTVVLDDISQFIVSIQPSNAAVPLFLMGHSMGGAEILTYASATTLPNSPQPDPRSFLRGYIAYSPFCALHPRSRPSSALVIAGRLAAKVLPRMQMKNELDASLLSHDKAVVERFVADPLCHDIGTLEGLEGMLNRAAHLEDGRVVLHEGVGGAGKDGKTAVLVEHGTDDQICDFHATEGWYETSCKVEDRTFTRYEGWYHRLSDEEGAKKQEYAEGVVRWILARA